jgi:hypothetical protein
MLKTYHSLIQQMLTECPLCSQFWDTDNRGGNVLTAIFSNSYHFFMLKTFKILFSTFLKCTEHYCYLQSPYRAIAHQNVLPHLILT